MANPPLTLLYEYKCHGLARGSRAASQICFWSVSGVKAKMKVLVRFAIFWHSSPQFSPFLHESIAKPTVPFVLTKWIFSANCANQENFVPTKSILRQPSGYCANQVDIVPTKWILRQPSEFCARQVDFVLTKWILC